MVTVYTTAKGCNSARAAERADDAAERSWRLAQLLETVIHAEGTARLDTICALRAASADGMVACAHVRLTGKLSVLTEETPGEGVLDVVGDTAGVTEADEEMDEGEGEADGEAEGETEGDDEEVAATEDDTVADAEIDTDAATEGDTDDDAEGDTDADAEGDSDAVADGEADADAEPVDEGEIEKDMDVEKEASRRRPAACSRRSSLRPLHLASASASAAASVCESRRT